MHKACQIGSWEAVKLLLENGGNLGLKSHSGLMALHVAAKMDHKKFVFELMRHYPWLVPDQEKVGNLGDDTPYTTTVIDKEEL